VEERKVKYLFRRILISRRSYLGVLRPDVNKGTSHDAITSKTLRMKRK